jgi:CRP/FNR family transcriptional regulator
VVSLSNQTFTLRQALYGNSHTGSIIIMLTDDTLSRIMQQYPVLRGLSSSEFGELFETANLLQLAAGTVVFDEKQRCQGFPLLLSGSLRVVKSAASGRELRLYRVLPGESCILTSSCLLGDTPYQARGLAEEPLEMVVLPARVFHNLIDKHIAFRRYVFQIFSERITGLMELVTAVAFHKLDQRLAALLVGKSATIHATHQSLADELGSAREIVSRLLKGFAEQGWVRLGREQITIIDESAIKKFAEL